MFKVYYNFTVIQVPSKLFSNKQKANSSESVTVYLGSAKFGCLLYYTINLSSLPQTTPLALTKISPKKYIYNFKKSKLINNSPTLNILFF